MGSDTEKGSSMKLLPVVVFFLFLFSSIGGAAASESGAMIAYGQNPSDYYVPRYQTWDPIANEWSGEGSASNVEDKPIWVILESSPTNLNEKIMGVIDTGGTLDVEVWNGNSWTDYGEFESSVSYTGQRSFDIAYERNSGDAIIVYTKRGFNAPMYKVWDASAKTWTAPQSVMSEKNGEPVWINLDSKPGSDEITLVYTDDSRYTYAIVWDGSSWGNVKQLESRTGDSYTSMGSDVKYMQQSGKAMVVWVTGSSDNYVPQYRIWDGAGSGWSTSDGSTGFSSSLEAARIRLSADPSSDRLAVGVIGSTSSRDSLRYRIYDGSWSDEEELTSSGYYSYPTFNYHSAWESQSGDLLVVYGKRGQSSCYYRTWSSSGSWSTNEYVINVGGDHPTCIVKDGWVEMDADTNSDAIQVGTVDSDYTKELHVSHWNGNGFDHTENVESNMYDQRYGTFMISYDKVMPPMPDTEPPVISGATGNAASTTGDAKTVSATITDNEDVVSATVYYTPIDGVETSIAMTEGLSDVWSADVPVAADKTGTITYYITASDGAENSARDPAAEAYSITVTDNDAPTADAGTDKSAIPGETVNFDGSGSSDNIGITQYEWDFTSDGTYDATGATTSHAYPAEGTYTVTLRVRDAAGNTATDTLTVTVAKAPDTEPPVISGATGNAASTTGDAKTVSATITDNEDVVSATVYYTPIDGVETSVAMTEGVSDVWSADVPVAEDKTGTITYYITASDGAENSARAPAAGTYSITVTDNDAPVADAGADKSAVSGETVNFDGTGSSDNIGITQYEWDFTSDGTYDASGVTASYVYDTTGTYDVTLRVTDGAGLTATDSLTVTVAEPVDNPPVADAGLDRSAQPGETVYFDGDGSTDDYGIKRYEWDFNNDGVYEVTGIETSYAWSTEGTYPVTLRVTDTADQTDTDTVTVTVSSEITVYSLELLPGWEMIGWPFEERSASEALASIDGSWDSLWRYTGYEWEVCEAPCDVGDGDFTTLKPGFGYYISMANPDTLTMSGIVVQPTVTVLGNQGWTMFGWPYEERNVYYSGFPDYTPSGTELYIKIAYWDNSLGNFVYTWHRSYYGDGGNAIGNFKPGRGYWIEGYWGFQDYTFTVG